jgi:hypothetical protein
MRPQAKKRSPAHFVKQAGEELTRGDTKDHLICKGCFERRAPLKALVPRYLGSAAAAQKLRDLILREARPSSVSL